MGVFKRGRVYWFHFWFNGDHIQCSTKQGNPRVARQMEAAFRTALAKGEVGILEKKSPPTLKDFAQRFIDYTQTRSAQKPKTIDFYAQQLRRLLEFEPLAGARLDKIDEALIERFVQYRSQQPVRTTAKKGKRHHPSRSVQPASVNRALATVRKLLRIAHEWRLVDRVPRIRLLPGERNREFVLSHEQERIYLEAASQPLQDVALFDVDTGLRVGEALQLEWRDVHLEPANGARFGYVHVRCGKSKYARRNVPLTERVRTMLLNRQSQRRSPFVFADNDGKPLLVTSLDHQHSVLRNDTLHLSKEFVLHSLRHTYGTRLGEAGADAFTIMCLMGHSSVTVSQRYVHPTPEALERAVERLESFNEKARKNLSEGQERLIPATVPATAGNHVLVSH